MNDHTLSSNVPRPALHRGARLALLGLLTTVIIGQAPAQKVWSNGTFAVAEPLNTPGTGIHPTTHGAFPLVTFGGGAWHFVDGNAVRSRVFDAGSDTFFPHTQAFYFATQYVDTGNGTGFWQPETTVALAAGQDRVIAFSDAGRVGTREHFADPFYLADEADCPDNLSRLRDLAYSPYVDRWVAVAAKIFSSETGASDPDPDETVSSWITRRGNQGTGEIWQAVTAGPSFVAVSDNGRAIRSLTGISWLAPTTIDASISFQDVHYAAGHYVAVGGDKIYSSPDGIAWTARYTYPGASFRSVTHGNGTWVAITTTGDRVHYSTDADASAWSSHANITPTPLTQIVYGEGIFVAVGSGGKFRWSKASLQVPPPVAMSSGGGSSFRGILSDWDQTRWFASSPDEWIRLAGNWDPSGSGTGDILSFLATENTGHDRTGCIEVNGRPFPVFQPGQLGPVAVPFQTLEVHEMSFAFLVTWGDITTETGYQVERWTDESGVFTTVANLPADTTYYSDSSLDPGDQYQYRITPTGSGEPALTTPILVALDANEGPKTVAVPLGDDRILVAWSPYAITNYLLTRNGTHLLPNVSGSDPQGYLDKTFIDDLSGTPLEGGFEGLTYQVSYNQGTASSFIPFPAIGLLSPPLFGQTIGTAEPLSNTANKLVWQPAAAQSGGDPVRFRYRVESDLGNSGIYEERAVTDSPGFSHHFGSGEQHRYRIQAYPVSAPDSSSGYASLCSRFPARPIDLEPFFGQTTLSLVLKFSDYNADSWELQQQAASGSWFTVQTGNFDSVTEIYTANDLIPGNTYNFRVRTTWRGISSDWVESGAQKSDLADPLAPLVNDSDPGEIFLNWPDLNGADVYQVQRSLTGTGGWTTLTATATDSRYTDTSVTPQTTYYYRVRGAHAWDNSGYSPVVSGTPPLDLAIIFNYHDLRRFRFTPPAGYASAVLQRSTSSSFNTPTEVATYTPRPPFDAMLISDTQTLGIGTFYYYRVRFTGVAGNPTTEARQIYPPVAPATSLTAVTAVVSGKDVVNLTWTAPPSGMNYDVERRAVTTPVSEFEIIATDVATTSLTDSRVESGATYEYHVFAKGPFPFWQPSRPSNIATVSFGNTVAAWRNFHFGTTANTGDAANTADPDGGGLGNLGELLFDRDPNDPSDDTVLFIEPEPNPSPLMRVFFSPREDFLDWPVDFILKAGTGLSSLPTDLSTQVTINPIDKSHEFFADSRLELQQFFRLEFEEQ